MKICSDQIERLAETRVKSTGVLESNQKRTVEVCKSSEHLKETIEEMQVNVDSGRVELTELQIETEEERYTLIANEVLAMGPCYFLLFNFSSPISNAKMIFVVEAIEYMKFTFRNASLSIISKNCFLQPPSLSW